MPVSIHAATHTKANGRMLMKALVGQETLHRNEILSESLDFFII